ITSDNETPCILISNTDVHYIIEDCDLSGTLEGISGWPAVLLWSTNGIIKDSNIHDCDIAIRTLGSKINVFNNSLSNCLSSGIIEGGNNNTFRLNNITSTGSSGFQSVFFGGINPIDSVVVNNTFFSTPTSYPESQILLSRVSGIMFINNTIISHNNVMDIGLSQDLYFKDNDVKVDSTQVNVIDFYFCINVTIEGDSVSSIPQPHYRNNVMFTSSNNITIMSTSLTNTTVYCDACSGINIVDTVFLDGGLRTIHSRGEVNVTSSTFEGADGLSIYSDSPSFVTDNVLYSCGGMYVHSNDSIVHNNTVTHSGEVFTDGSRNTFTNNTIIHCGIGIEIEEGANNSVFYNLFLDNIIYIVDNGVNTLFDNNVDMGNYWDIVPPVNDRWPVVLDDDAPIIEELGDITLNVSELSSLVWNIIDKTPTEYTIYIDGEVIYSGEWNSSQITLDISSLTEGTYNLTLVVTDYNGNTASTTTILTVTSETTTTPTTTTLPDLTVLYIALGAGATVIAIIMIILFVRRRSRT
ncbi:MAG: NosD domain-containing protein, partial [Candidatus Thorarchaeota archaeon]